MKVVISSIFSIFVTIIFCYFYVIPNIINHVEVDTILKLVISKKICDQDHKKAKFYISNEINNTILVLFSKKKMTLNEIIYLMKNSPKERFCSSDIIKKGLDRTLFFKICSPYKRVQGNKNKGSRKHTWQWQLNVTSLVPTLQE